MPGAGSRAVAAWRRAIACGGFALALAFTALPEAGAQATADAGKPLDAALLARNALGTEAGSASIAIWRDGLLIEAGVRRAGAPAAALEESKVDAAALLYEWGSVSKVFTGLLLAQAVERGELRLEDTLGSLLEGQVKFGSPQVAAITLRQLVTHTACLPRQFGRLSGGPAIVAQITTADRAQLWAALGDQQLAQAAPCAYGYSNYGFAVLGELLAQRTGQDWFALVQQRITGPLGMRDTVQALSAADAARMAPSFNGAAPGRLWDMRAFSGAGALRGTAADLARFGRALAQGRSGPLGAAAERLVTPLAEADGASIGYAIFITGPAERRTWSHDGLTGAYRALLTVAPDTGEVLASLVSNDRAPQVYAEVMARRYPVTATEVPLDAARLAQYQGVFHVRPELTLVSVVQDGRLYVRSLPRGVFRAYIPVGEDRFARPAGGALLSFQRAGNAGRAITGATLSQWGYEHVGRRTDDAVPVEPVLRAGEAAAYAGRFSVRRLLAANLRIEVQALDGQLMVAVGDGPTQPVWRLAGQADAFRYDKAGAEIRFTRDAQGRVTSLSLRDNGRTLDGVREAAP